ncbi:MAG: hypothetical protein COU71_00495 [Parcubacteria group bacterium CG10_big_fil_rev_8_21_14_0_10_38_31]|nr:MAG: hypothetical protein COU71_00495 [Parcubacteria group bacterium CG10_big_fil_rev_8_21_14_0_10_38_31]
MQSIKEYFKKIKSYEADIIISLTIILVAFLSFGLGRLSKIEENNVPITIENTRASVLSAQSAQNLQNTATNPQLGGGAAKLGVIVASKNGTKYHFPWCSGAIRIKDENKIWFGSESEAKSAGYGPASNCKGLK